MIVIEIEKTGIEYANKIQEVCGETTGVIFQKSFSGVSEVIQIGVDLTLASVPILAGIIIEMIRNNKKVRIKTGEIEIENLSEDNALKILEQLLERNKKVKGKK